MGSPDKGGLPVLLNNYDLSGEEFVWKKILPAPISVELLYHYRKHAHVIISSAKQNLISNSHVAPVYKPCKQKGSMSSAAASQFRHQWQLEKFPDI